MKFLLTGLILLTTTTAIMAQDADFGIKGGLNLANFTNENGTEYKMKPDIHLGILVHIHLNKMFAVQPELLFSGQGTKFNTGNSDFRYSLNYINLPVLLQLMTESGIRFETGPQVGVLVGAKAKSGGNSVDIKDNFKSTDFAWVFGIGYITPKKFGFDFRYNLGLADITKATSSNIKNSVIQLGVFYQFHK